MCTRLTERSEELRSTHPDREQSQGTLDRLCHSRSGSGTLSTLTRVGRAAQCKAKCGVCELKVRAVNAHICRTHSTFRHVLRVRQICSLVRVVSLKKGYICPRGRVHDADQPSMRRVARASALGFRLLGCWGQFATERTRQTQTSARELQPGTRDAAPLSRVSRVDPRRLR